MTDKQKIATKKWREENREHYNRIHREWAAKNPDKVKATRIRRRAKSRLYQRNKIRKQRLKIIEYLGAKCKWCGFTDWRALQVDHVNGRGTKENKKIGNYKVLGQVMTDTSGKYQLLCANCNWIKKYENDEVHRELKK